MDQGEGHKNKGCLYFLALSFFFFPNHTTWSLWDPSSPTRNRIQAASSEGAES